MTLVQIFSESRVRRRASLVVNGQQNFFELHDGFVPGTVQVACNKILLSNHQYCEVGNHKVLLGFMPIRNSKIEFGYFTDLSTEFRICN